MDKEERQRQQEFNFIRREAKRAQRPKKHYVMEPDDDSAPAKKKARHVGELMV